MKVLWEGVYPAVTTKFKKDETLDIDTFKSNIDAQIKAGVDGIIVGGSLGENSVLNHEEKQILLEAALEVSAGRVPVLICIAECTTRDALKFVKNSKATGANGFMLLPPMRYTSDDRETLHYLETVARATDLPIMIYNNPIAYNIMITEEMFHALAKYPNIQAIKESTGDIRTLTNTINTFGDRFKILMGVDNLAMEGLLMGADGWVAGLVCAFPEETVAIYRLIKAGRKEEALAIYRWFYPILDLDVSTKLVQNIKLAEAITGLGTEYVRQPRLTLAGEEREQVLKIIHDGLATRPSLPKHLYEVESI